MGRVVLIYGRSGSGKSRSLKNFAEDEIFLNNVEDKDLPFRNKFKYVISSDDYSRIKNGLAKMPVKIAVIDDAGYLLTNTFMRGHSGGHRGNQVFELYNDIADNFWGLFEFIKRELPPDVIVYIIMHEDILPELRQIMHILQNCLNLGIHLLLDSVLHYIGKQSLGIFVAARKAASAAVDTGQTRADIL